MLRAFIYIQLLIGFQLSFAQKESVKFERINAADGLVNEFILDIFKDSQGFMWFGTYGGVDRFDGYEHRFYSLNNNPQSGIIENTFHSIFEDNRGNLWFGTHEGLLKYSWHADTFSYFKHIDDNPASLSNNAIRQIIQDEEGALWIATYGGGLNKFDIESGIFRSYRHDTINAHSIPSDRINTIFIDRQNTFWVGTEGGGLSRFDKKNGTFKSFSEVSGISSILDEAIVSAIFEDENSNLWIGTWGNGIFEYNRQTNRLINFNKIAGCTACKENYNVRDIAGDSKGNIWFVSMGEGITSYNTRTEQFSNYKNKSFDESTLSYNLVWSVFIDESDIIWIGTAGSGICILDPQNNKFKHFRQESDERNTLTSNYITSILSDSFGNLWLGTEQNGLNVLKKNSNEYTYLLNEPSLQIGAVRALYEDEDHNLWVGTDRGIFVYNTKLQLLRQYWTRFDSQGGGSNRPIEKICMDKFGNLWFATWSSGLFMLSVTELKKKNSNEAIFVNYRNNPTDSSSLSSDVVWEIYSDSKGNLWAGCEDQLDKFNFENKTFSHFNIVGVSDVIESNKGLWVTTFGFGIYLIDINTYSVVNLGYKEIVSAGVELDSESNLWIPSQQGLFKYNPTTNNLVVFSESDGLQGNKFNQGSVAKSSDGKIFIGGFYGYNVFDPSQISIDSSRLRLIFTDFFINGQSASYEKGQKNPWHLQQSLLYTDTIALTYDQQNIAFEFAALNYSGASHVKYRYRLNPNDTSWYYTTAASRKANYTNLNPGTYTLLVEATNRDGMWSPKNESITVIITPAWYQTLFFRIFVLLLLSALIFQIFKLRVKKIKLKNSRLEEIVEARTKELSYKNKLLSKQTDQLNEINTLLEERQQSIEEQSAKLQEVNLELFEKNELLRKQAESLNETNTLLVEQSEELGVQKEVLQRMNKELAEANATKDKFFSIIAHDIKNPFGTLMGFIELMQINYSTWNQDKIERTINVLAETSKKVYNLLENLLQWSRSQRGVLEYQPQMLNIDPQIEKVFSLLKETAEKKNISLTLQQNGMNLEVFADEMMLDTILRNLIGNAIKFTENGGKIYVSTFRKEENVMIEVADTGVGMDAEQLQKIFKIDSHHSTQGTNHESGTGLGLILASEFITKQGGKIGVRSKLNEGTVFYFSLPFER